MEKAILKTKGIYLLASGENSEIQAKWAAEFSARGYPVKTGLFGDPNLSEQALMAKLTIALVDGASALNPDFVQSLAPLDSGASILLLSLDGTELQQAPDHQSEGHLFYLDAREGINSTFSKIRAIEAFLVYEREAGPKKAKKLALGFNEGNAVADSLLVSKRDGQLLPANAWKAERKHRVWVGVLSGIGAFITLSGTLAFFVYGLPAIKEAIVQTYYIHEEAELYAAKNRQLNDHYILMNDLSLTVPFAGADQPFSGTFDGNGHTLTLKETVTAWIERITSKGVVKNLSLVYSDPAVIYSPAFGGFTNRNDGLIDNCALTLNGGVTADSDPHGGIASLNFGTISHCVVGIHWNEIDNSAISYTEGGLAGISFDGSEILNCLVTVTSSYLENHNAAYRSGSFTLPSIGAVVGQSSSKASLANLYAARQDNETFADRFTEGVRLIPTSNMVASEFVYSTLGLSRSLWSSDGTALPTLIANSIVPQNGRGQS